MVDLQELSLEELNEAKRMESIVKVPNIHMSNSIISMISSNEIGLTSPKTKMSSNVQALQHQAQQNLARQLSKKIQ